MNALNWYDLAGWVSLGLGITLFMLGLFARRFVVSKSPRCARCGYALITPEGDHLSRCPECGRVPRSPTEMYTLRRRWLLLGLGTLLFVAGVALPFVPAMRQQGWSSVLPISVQVGMWDTGDAKLRQRVLKADQDGILTGAEISMLERRLLAALSDPQTPQTVINDARFYISSYHKPQRLLNEHETSLALSKGNTQAKSMILGQWFSAPQTTELLEIRRQLTHDENRSIRRDALTWLFRSPSDHPEDLDSLRSLVAESTGDLFWDVLTASEDGNPRAAVGVSKMLDTDDKQVRYRAMLALNYMITRNRQQLATQVYERVIDHADDPTDEISDLALRSLEDMHENALPALDRLYRTPISNARTASILHEFRRMDEWSVALIPAVATIAQDPGRTFEIRLDAWDACQFIRSRYRDSTPLPDRIPIYQNLVRELETGDIETALRLGKYVGPALSPPLLAAMVKELNDEGITGTEAINTWFEPRPVLAAILQLWSPDTQNPDAPRSHAVRLAGLIEMALADTGLAEDIAIPLEQANETLFANPAENPLSP